MEDGDVTHHFESWPIQIISVQISEQKIFMCFFPLKIGIIGINQLKENLTEKPRRNVELTIAM